MNYDELAFFNQQLAGMLKSGIPLEPALHQLSSTMQRGKLREEMGKLETDLAQGIPLEKALEDRDLPRSYVEMLKAGVRGNDLPGTLTLVADHYQRLSTIFSRLSGLMVYPVLVLGTALCLSAFFLFLQHRITNEVGIEFPFGYVPFHLKMLTWLPPVTILLLFVAALIALSSHGFRNRIKWRVPALQDAYLAQLCSTGEIMLRRGNTLPDTLGFLAELEKGTRAEAALLSWKSSLAEGRTEMSSGATSPLPPLFFWLLKSAGDNLPDGFARAANLYQKRAARRIEMLLFAAVPISVIILAVMILVQVYPMVLQLMGVMDGGLG